MDIKHKCDAIVNTTSSDLNLKNGTVSKLIFHRAGDQIQNELSTNYPKGLDKKNLVAMSSVGNLKNCGKYIFHIALSDYDSQHEKKIEDIFKKTVAMLCEKADEKECASIAMPAFGKKSSNDISIKI